MVLRKPSVTMATRKQPDRTRGGIAAQAATCLLLAAMMLFISTWAKASRYDLRAVPSPHFSKSVKMARGLFLNALGDEPVALTAANPQLAEPQCGGAAPAPLRVTADGAAPLPFQRLRAPPSAA